MSKNITIKTAIDPQLIYDSHLMSKSEFVDFYKTKCLVKDKIEVTTQYLSTLWHTLRKKPKPTDIKRKSRFDDIAESWTAPEWGPGGDPALKKPIKKTASKTSELKHEEKEESKEKPKEESRANVSTKSRLDQVKDLLSNGITSSIEISKKIGTNPSYVSRLIKKIDNEK